MTFPRMFVVLILLLLVLGLLIWARGTPHHHGQYVGSLGATHGAAIK